MREYKTVRVPTEFGFFSGTQFDGTTLESHLNLLGREGWELVSTLYISTAEVVIAVLKKKLP